MELPNTPTPQSKPPKRRFSFRGTKSLKDQGIWGFWLDIVLNLVIIVGMVVIIRTFLISPFQVYGSSMCNTFNYFDDQCNSGTGEYLIVNKLGYQNFLGWQIGLPKRGDVIVFHPPLNEKEFFIKRVIGLPGETVKLISGDVYIYNEENPSGFKLDEEYLSAENKGRTIPDPRGGPSIFEIPAGHYLVFGDNRNGSSDARHCFRETIAQGKCGEPANNTPFLSLDHIEGKAWIVLWPLSRISVVENPIY